MLGYRIQNFFAGWGEGERNLRVNFVCQGGLETYFCNLTMWFWEVRIFQGFWWGGGGGIMIFWTPWHPPIHPLDWFVLAFKPSVWISSSIILDHVGDVTEVTYIVRGHLLSEWSFNSKIQLICCSNTLKHSLGRYLNFLNVMGSQCGQGVIMYGITCILN